MNHLYRELAPISEAAWQALEDEARTRLVPYLGARKLVDFEGPLGWQHSATSLGRVEVLGTSVGEGVSAKRRTVLPLLEVRAPFEIARSEIDDVERGAQDNDFGDLERAARQIALTENRAVFHGLPAGAIRGITEASSHAALTLDADFGHYPDSVARAVNVLMEAGIGGPYGLALSPAEWTGVIETSEHGGILVFDHLRRILDGPIVWTPGVAHAVVLSLRGGDFRMEVGQDLSIGYLAHDAENVTLYLEQTFNFRVTEPDAAIELRR
jgi:uncharacterized linocin/CFP29 family protein